MTTYGIYTADLSGCAPTGKDSLEEAKKLCYGDHVVCVEKSKNTEYLEWRCG